MASAKTKH